MVLEMVWVTGSFTTLLHPELMTSLGYAARAVGIAIERLSMYSYTDMVTATILVSVDVDMAVNVVLCVKLFILVMVAKAVTVSVADGMV